MKQLVTVLMIVQEQKDLLIKSIEAIRRYASTENLQVVVVDNASEDGTKEWLATQEDIAYAVEEQRVENWGKMVNEAIQVFGIEGDILFMQAGCFITEGCIEWMNQTLYMEDNIAAVGPMINGRNKGIDASLFSDENSSRRVLGLDEKMVMIRGDIFSSCFTGRVEEGYHMYMGTILDYFISAIQMGKSLYCVRNAIVMAENYLEDFLYRNRINDEDFEKIRDRWGMKYFNGIPNNALISMIDKKGDAISVLEIGCDCGATLLEVKNQFPCSKVYGYEINPNAAVIAKSVAEVEVGNVEEQQFPYQEKQFDYIILGDVLEHLHNPEKTIRYCRSFLKEEGYMVVSIPNLMHISVMHKLLEGFFTYSDIGLLDRTHIHLFTYNEIVGMFTAAGYTIEDVNFRLVAISEKEEQMLDKIMTIVESSKRWMFEAFQYILRVKK